MNWARQAFHRPDSHERPHQCDVCQVSDPSKVSGGNQHSNPEFECFESLRSHRNQSRTSIWNKEFGSNDGGRCPQLQAASYLDICLNGSPQPDPRNLVKLRPISNTQSVFKLAEDIKSPCDMESPRNLHWDNKTRSQPSAIAAGRSTNCGLLDLVHKVD